jgi:hypothetical protein
MSPPQTIIVAALIRRDESLLLVEQQGLWDPKPSWMLAGGRDEPGDTLSGEAPPGTVYAFERE